MVNNAWKNLKAGHGLPLGPPVIGIVVNFVLFRLQSIGTFQNWPRAKRNAHPSSFRPETIKIGELDMFYILCIVYDFLYILYEVLFLIFDIFCFHFSISF